MGGGATFVRYSELYSGETSTDVQHPYAYLQGSYVEVLVPPVQLTWKDSKVSPRRNITPLRCRHLVFTRVDVRAKTQDYPDSGHALC